MWGGYLKKTAIMLMIVTVVSKLFGFAREITLSYFYGASATSDAYIVSLVIPQTIFAFLGIAIATCFVPIYSEIRKNSGPRGANIFTSNLINFLILLCSLFFVAGMFFTRQIVLLFASGFTGDTLNLAVKFTRITFVGVYFSGLTYICTSFLQVNNNFFIPSITGFPFNIAIIASIILSSKLDIIILAYGIVVAMALHFLILVPFVFREGYKHRFVLNYNDENIRKVAMLSMPVLLGSSVNQINKLVDKTLASRLAVGGISTLNYANRLNGFIFGIFVISISTAMYPLITKMATDNNINGLKKSLAEAISGTNLLVMPATVGMMIFARPIVSLLFGRGSFDENALIMTSSALFFYSIGTIGFGLREVLTKAFYSLKDTKTPKVNAAIAVVLNIVLNFILSSLMGISGLALATSISGLFCTFLLFVSLRKKIGSLGLRNISTAFIKVTIASLVMGLVSFVVFRGLAGILGDNMALLGAIGLGAGVYFVTVFLLKVEEMQLIVNKVRGKLR